jgi:hypothetical protein
MKRTPPQKRPTSITELEGRRELATLERFERRLEDGFELIEIRRAAGIDVTKLEDFWIELLHQYETLCDSLPMAA